MEDKHKEICLEDLLNLVIVIVVFLNNKHCMLRGGRGGGVGAKE